jgi:hypothetical protein
LIQIPEINAKLNIIRPKLCNAMWPTTHTGRPDPHYHASLKIL